MIAQYNRQGYEYLTSKKPFFYVFFLPVKPIFLCLQVDGCILDHTALRYFHCRDSKKFSAKELAHEYVL